MKESRKRDIGHKQKRKSDHAGWRWIAGGLGDNEGNGVVGFGSGSSEGKSSGEGDERRRVEEGAVMEEVRREDDITSYLKRSANSWRIECWFCTEVTTMLRNWKVKTFSIIGIGIGIEATTIIKDASAYASRRKAHGKKHERIDSLVRGVMGTSVTKTTG
jgi:hypothetical protein